MNDEEEVKRQTYKRLAHDFDVRQEVTGRHLLTDMPVRIDFMVKLRSHPVFCDGFPDGWIGIEAKYLQPHDVRKGAKLGAQCASYSQCAFKIDKEEVKPICILYSIPPFSNDAMGEGINKMLFYMRVGHFDLNVYGGAEWFINFGGMRYASSRYGMINLTKMNYDPFKVRAGNVG